MKLKLSDLRKSERSLRRDLEKLKHKSVSGAALEAVSKDLENVQREIENFSNSEGEVRELKDLVSATFSLVVDQRYKVGTGSRLWLKI